MTPRLIFGAIVGLLVIAGVTFIVVALRKDGARSVTDSINQQNQGAGHAGENARLGYRDCVARGLRFDFEAGQCRG